MAIEIYWAIILPFFMAFGLPVLGHLVGKDIRMRGALATLAILASFLILLTSLPEILAGKILVYEIGQWMAPYGIVLAVDAFNYLVALVVTGIAVAVALYSIRHTEIQTAATKFYTLLILITIGMLGVVLTGDLFNMFVFFEILSISSYALVAFRSNRPAAIEGAFKYLFMGSVGTSLILLAVAFLYSVTGTVNLADLADKLPMFHYSVVPVIALALLVTGFSVKAVLVPLHMWKPDALMETSSEVAGLIAGVSSAVGLYAIFRIAYTVFPYTSTVIPLLLILSMVTMVIGGLMAVVQTDLKRLLAYSSISQSGYVAFGLSLALFTATGAVGGLFHIFNHAIAKVLLFLCAGAIIYRTGTRNMNELGGLASEMPLTAVAFVIGALAVIGVPPTSGFISKWYLYVAGVEAGMLPLTIIAIFMSLITFAYYAKAINRVFLGPRTKLLKRRRKEVPLLMMLPMVVFVAIILIIGIYPQPLIALINQAGTILSSKAIYISTVLG
jgi:multicomponent Na+:H+ antiporter subunit D